MASYNLPIVASGNTIAKKNRSSVLDLTLGDLSNKKCHIVNAFIIEYFSGYQFPRTVELELWHKFGLTGQRPWSVWQDKRVIWLFCKLRFYYHMDSSCIKRKKEAETWLVFLFLIVKSCLICCGTIWHCINNGLHLVWKYTCMCSYLSAVTICSECSLRKSVSLEEQIMSKNKYFHPKWWLLCLKSMAYLGHEHIFTSNGGCCIYYPPSNSPKILRKLRNIMQIFPSYSWGISVTWSIKIKKISLI